MPVSRLGVSEASHDSAGREIRTSHRVAIHRSDGKGRCIEPRGDRFRTDTAMSAIEGDGLTADRTKTLRDQRKRCLDLDHIRCLARLERTLRVLHVSSLGLWSMPNAAAD